MKTFILDRYVNGVLMAQGAKVTARTIQYARWLFRDDPSPMTFKEREDE